MEVSQYNLSVESNQNVEPKRKSVKSKMGKWGIQLLAHLQFYNSDGYVKMVTSIFGFSSASGGCLPQLCPWTSLGTFVESKKSLNYTMGGFDSYRYCFIFVFVVLLVSMSCGNKLASCKFSLHVNYVHFDLIWMDDFCCALNNDASSDHTTSMLSKTETMISNSITCRPILAFLLMILVAWRT